MKPKVLVLDEDLFALELYSRELSLDYEVCTSESVNETLAQLQQEHFDALVVEPEVNEGEGWSLLKEARALDHPPSIVICSVEDDRRGGIEQGAQAFVTKPVLPTALHHLLNQVLARKALKTV